MGTTLPQQALLEVSQFLVLLILELHEELGMESLLLLLKMEVEHSNLQSLE